jgi:hypothetical protein
MRSSRSSVSSLRRPRARAAQRPRSARASDARPPVRGASADYMERAVVGSSTIAWCANQAKPSVIYSPNCSVFTDYAVTATCSQSIIHAGGTSAENLSPQSTSSVCVLKVGFANQYAHASSNSRTRFGNPRGISRKYEFAASKASAPGTAILKMTGAP